MQICLHTACALIVAHIARGQTPNERINLELQNESSLRAIRAVSATLIGDVVDTASRPLAGAEVSIPALNLITRTDADGKYRIADIPAGVHTVVVRQIGYAAISVALEFADNKTARKRFMLQRVIEIDSVAINGRRQDPAMIGFDTRSRSGIGTFLNRDKLARFDEQPLARVLPQLPGLRAIRGTGNRTWIASARFNGGLGLEGKAGLSRSDKLSGATQQCYAKIYVDNVMMYGGSAGEQLYDTSLLQVKDIEAIEYYAGSAQAPAQYGGIGASCGVMVIWMRKQR